MDLIVAPSWWWAFPNFQVLFGWGKNELPEQMLTTKLTIQVYNLKKYRIPSWSSVNGQDWPRTGDALGRNESLATASKVHLIYPSDVLSIQSNDLNVEEQCLFLSLWNSYIARPDLVWLLGCSYLKSIRRKSRIPYLSPYGKMTHTHHKNVGLAWPEWPWMRGISFISDPPNVEWSLSYQEAPCVSELSKVLSIFRDW